MFFFFILYKGNYTWYECNMHFTALFSQRAAEEIQNFGFGLIRDFLITVAYLRQWDTLVEGTQFVKPLVFAESPVDPSQHQES